MAKDRLRDIVIILPGIGGSVLGRAGEVPLWGTSGRVLWRTIRSLGRRLEELALDPDGAEDGIAPIGLIRDAHIVPGIVKIDGYNRMTSLVRDHFKVVEGSAGDPRPANLFEFPYDFRRDNRVTAHRLKELVDHHLPLWREHSGADDAKVVLIAHSMGGLVSRYWLEVLGGWEQCRALLTFGTPHRGSLDAIDTLANGTKVPVADLDAVMRSWPSVYQLMPRYRAVLAGGAYHRIGEMGATTPAGIDPGRAGDALAFHQEISDAVDEHLGDIGYRDARYTMLPVIGTRQRTKQSAIVDGDGVRLSEDVPAIPGFDPGFGDGDGTVPRVSAIPIEASEEHSDTYVGERHSSLQNSPTMLFDLRERLLKMQKPGLDAVRGGVHAERRDRTAIGVGLDDVYLVGEPVEIRADVVGGAHDLVARVMPVEGDGPPREFPFAADGGGRRATIEGLPAAPYRLQVAPTTAAPGAPDPVHDLFEVVE